MKRFRKIVSMILALTFMLSTIVSATGVTNEDVDMGNAVTMETKLGVISMLRGMEAHKEAIGLAGVNFCDLKIGNPVYVYNYINNQFCEDRQMYPLIEGNELVAWAIPIGDKYQITPSLAGNVNEIVSMQTAFALIYDRTGGYLYYNNTFVRLTEYEAAMDRSILDNSISPPAGAVVTTALAENTDLGYSVGISPAAINATAICNITPVCQYPYENICWAACIACIVNSCNGTNYTARDVAVDYYGSDFQHGLRSELMPSVFSDYGLLYTFGDVPSDNTMLANLMSGYPILGGFERSDGQGHACVIYGIDTSNSYVYVMNPSYDTSWNANNPTVGVSPYSTATYSNGTYEFLSNNSNMVLSMIDALCHTW